MISDGRYIFDRMEEGLYVLTAPGGEIALPSLPAGAKEGDTIVSKGGELFVDTVDTEARRLRIEEKRKALFNPHDGK